MRVKFRVWPGQGGIIERVVKQNVVQTLRQFDPMYADWMVVVHYRAEPKHKTRERLLPRPAAALQRFQKAEAEDQAHNVGEEDTPKRRNLFTSFLSGLYSPLERPLTPLKRRVQTEQISHIEEQGIFVFAEILRGDPAKVIVDVAETSGANLIVLGTHCRIGSDAFWNGSVGAKIVTQTHQPLLLVPVKMK